MVLLDPTARPVIGHRGNAAHAPENTLESFQQAAALGVDALEMDVHLSADGEVVVIHDPTLERTTDARGTVAQLPLAAIRAADAGAGFSRDGGVTHPYRGRGIRVPTFAEVLETFPAMPLLVEIKTARASAALRTLIERYGAESRIVVEAYDPAAMVPFVGSRIATGASSADVRRLLVPALTRRRIASLPYRVASVPRSYRGVPLPIAGFVRSTASAGCLIHVWTVNVAAEARALWDVGVRGIISDDPGVILGERNT